MAAASNKLPVVVIGAGPAGLMAGLQLRLRGVPVRVVDRKTTLTPLDRSKALSLHIPSVHTMQALGVYERLHPYIQEIRNLRVHSSTSSKIATVQFDQALRDHTPFPYIASVPQGVTERVLYERFVQLGGAVEWGTEATVSIADATDAAAPDGGPPVRVTLTSGTAAATESFDASYVVVCEGSHSSIRKAAGIAFEGKTYTQHFVLADAVLHVPNDFDGNAFHATFLPAQAMVVFPMNGPVVPVGSPLAADAPELPPASSLPPARKGTLFARLILVEPSGAEGAGSEGVVREHGVVAADAANDALALREKLDISLKELDTTIETVTWLTRFGVNARMASRFQHGRIFFCGDSAHIHSPAGGHGMNSGFADVTNLVWKLDLVLRGAAPPSLLASYAVERQFILASTLANTDRITGFATSSSSIFRAIRDIAIPLIVQLPTVQKTASLNVAMLNYHYEKGAGALFRNADHPLVGHHIPHALLTSAIDGRQQTLLDVITHCAKGQLLVLVSASSAAAAAEIISAAITVNRAARLGGGTSARDVLSGVVQYAAIVVDGGALPAGSAPVAASNVFVDSLGHFRQQFGKSSARIYVRPDLYIGAVCNGNGKDFDSDLAYLSLILKAL